MKTACDLELSLFMLVSATVRLDQPMLSTCAKVMETAMIATQAARLLIVDDFIAI